MSDDRADHAASAVPARTRSEYRRSLAGLPALPESPVRSRPIADSDRAQLADLMLDAYRGTVDDEGEGPDEALEAIDLYLRVSVRHHSIVVPDDGDGLLAFCSVSVVNDVHYIDPIVVAAAGKGRGLGTRIVLTVLHSLADAGVDEVGATITDGNEPSERLFASLGFVRLGAWE